MRKKLFEGIDSDKPLTPRETLFVAEYLKSLNATDAAKLAGFSAKTAHSQGPRLLNKPNVKAAIAAGAGAKLEKLKLEGDDVLRELKALGFSNVRKLFNEKGQLMDPRLLDDETSAAIASIEVEMTPGDGELDDGAPKPPTPTLVKVKFWDKPKSLELLGKYFNLWADRVVHATDPGNDTSPPFTRDERRAELRMHLQREGVPLPPVLKQLPAGEPAPLVEPEKP